MKDKKESKINAKYENKNCLFIAAPYCVIAVGVRTHYGNEKPAKCSFKLLDI
jgi:hypothetical protein